MLLDLRGIGRWTGEYVLLRGLGRINVFPGDDVGARNRLARWLGRRPADGLPGRIAAPFDGGTRTADSFTFISFSMGSSESGAISMELGRDAPSHKQQASKCKSICPIPRFCCPMASSCPSHYACDVDWERKHIEWNRQNYQSQHLQSNLPQSMAVMTGAISRDLSGRRTRSTAE